MSILLLRNLAKCMTDMAAGHCRKRLPLAWEQRTEPGGETEASVWRLWLLLDQSQASPCLLPSPSAAARYSCRKIWNTRKTQQMFPRITATPVRVVLLFVSLRTSRPLPLCALVSSSLLPLCMIGSLPFIVFTPVCAETSHWINSSNMNNPHSCFI